MPDDRPNARPFTARPEDHFNARIRENRARIEAQRAQIERDHERHRKMIDLLMVVWFGLLIAAIILLVILIAPTPAVAGTLERSIEWTIGRHIGNGIAGHGPIAIALAVAFIFLTRARRRR